MKRPAITAVMACAGVLVLLMLAEWIGGMARIARIEHPAPTPAAAPDQKVAAVTTGATDDQVDGWLQTVLDRPLMTPSRAAAKSGGPLLALNGGLPRLAGTLASVTAGGDPANTAIFARDDGGKPLIVHQGGLLGSWRVTHIDANSVTLEGPEGRQTLHPRFGNGPAPPVAAGNDDGPPTPQPFIPGQPLNNPNLPAGLPGMGQPGFPVQNFPNLPNADRTLQPQSPSQ